MGKFLKILFAAFAAACIASACSTSGCLDNGSALPLAGFYSSSEGKQIEINNIEIHGVGARNDSILLEYGTAKSSVYLPMRSDRKSTSWAIIYKQSNLAQMGITDTITFGYKSIAYFASMDCGAMYNYQVDSLSYTTNLIDSVVVTRPLINNADVESIRIYFHTATEEGDAQ